ncbi:putative signaling protein [Saliniradius amylolyticus]|uniref:diguanylate cyclase n=1 Tax=Saliniradius amylolyticus TaxID=2183582 RepID=A0A2S2E4N9_9ALTE|nr:GGDEF domain-containing protein [Saliniradius amylolyticus]AWL12628.1 putative signaling protein [Saliniradius amylolyticus]
MDSSVTAQRRALRSFKYQIDTLAQFIVRLSAFFQGARPALDEELQMLRRHMGGKLAFNEAEASMRAITGLMLEQTDLFRQMDQQAEHLIREVLRHLQSQPTLPADLSDEAEQLRRELAGTAIHFTDSLPLFQRLLNMQQRALEAQPGSVSVSNDPGEDSRLKSRLLNELKHLVAQVTQHSDKQQQLQDIERQLAEPMSERQLVECCLMLLKHLFQNIYQERAHAEEFVDTLHQSLTTVSTNLEQSLKDNEQQYQQKLKNNADMRACMEDMEGMLAQSNDLEQLKAKSQVCLDKMAQSMNAREQYDQQDQAILVKLLGEMRQQLIQLEKETSQYRQRLESIRNQNQCDALTRLPNRNAYDTKVRKELAHWQKEGKPLSLALVDVDHFKSINDNYGHTAGDKTLQVLAQQITKCLRHEDFMARWGGEEFVVLLPDTDLEQLQTPLEKIRQRVERIPFKFKNQQVTITVSIGATQFVQGDSIESAFERADQALYQAKRDGRNQNVVIEGPQ